MRSTFMHELWAVPGLYRATTAVTKDFFVFVLEIFVGFFVMWDAGGGGGLMRDHLWWHAMNTADLSLNGLFKIKSLWSRFVIC